LCKNSSYCYSPSATTVFMLILLWLRWSHMEFWWETPRTNITLVYFPKKPWRTRCTLSSEVTARPAGCKASFGSELNSFTDLGVREFFELEVHRPAEQSVNWANGSPRGGAVPFTPHYPRFSGNVSRMSQSREELQRSVTALFKLYPWLCVCVYMCVCVCVCVYL